MAKLLYLISEDWFFYSHFIERAKAAQSQGFEVVVMTRERLHGEKIRSAGFRLLPLTMRRSSINVWSELAVIRQIWKAYREEKPDLLHHVALKPIIYGTLVARLLGVRQILNAPVGMGYMFTSRDLKARLIQPFVRASLRHLLNPPGSKVIFENSEDLGHYVEQRSVQATNAVLIPGAGVDIDAFHPEPSTAGVPVVVMGARMLRDKGVGEFVEAARLLRERGAAVVFWLVGAPDPGNPSSFTEAQLRQWDAEGAVRWLGHREDMSDLLRQCQIACLPSYREGLPKFLLEAMASGLAVVSTDVPGCREAVVHGETGLLVPARDAAGLADGIERLLNNAEERSGMAQRGRQRAETEFSLTRIIEMTMHLYASMAEPARSK